MGPQGTEPGLGPTRVPQRTLSLSPGSGCWCHGWLWRGCGDVWSLPRAPGESRRLRVGELLTIDGDDGDDGGDGDGGGGKGVRAPREPRLCGEETYMCKLSRKDGTVVGKIKQTNRPARPEMMEGEHRIIRVGKDL